MMAVEEQELRAHIRARFLHWAWMGPVGNAVAASVWGWAIAPAGLSDTVRAVWLTLAGVLCVLMGLAYLVPRSVAWTDPSGIPWVSLASIGTMGVLWGSALWLLGDVGERAPMYVYGTTAVLLGLCTGSMGSSCGVARVTGVFLLPMSIGATTAMIAHGFAAAGIGVLFLTVIVAPVVMDSAAGIRELLRLRIESEESACHDPLTGLLNRRGLGRAVGDFRNGQSVALFYADLDLFKSINDQYGHTAGDQVLVDVAERLSTSMPDSTLVARVGGDEFVIVAPSELGDPTVLRRLIGEAFVDLFEIAGRAGTRVEVRASLGCVEGLASQVHSHLIARADFEMMEVKRSRRPILSIVESDDSTPSGGSSSVATRGTDGELVDLQPQTGRAL